MNGAQALVEALVQYDTRVVFGLPGDTSVGLYDALYARSNQITHVMARDERGAAFMADVYARLTGKPGVCEGPSGGGATYMLPGVVEAFKSSVPLIALTTDNPLDYEAQGALTDLDQSQLYLPVTKWAPLIKSANALPRFVRRAFRLATSGRPGAVHLALPKDVLAEAIRPDIPIYAEDACKVWPSYRTRPAADVVSRAARKFLQSHRPVIVAGGGALSSGASAELLAVAEYVGAPVATTVNGKGAIAETAPLSLGVIGGNGGRPYANRFAQEADLVLFVGCKVNYVDTDNWRVPSRQNPPTILQIDVDPSELGNNYDIAEGLCGDAKLALADLRQALQDNSTSPVDRPAWLGQLARLKEIWQAERKESLQSTHRPINPQRIVAELARALPEESVIVCDPGSQTPFLAAEFELRCSGRYSIFPRAHGGLGYTIPGLVGARFARSHSPVVGLCGDGSFVMSASDLVTVARVGGPVVLLLLNNGSYGWIKALQRMESGGRYLSVDFTEDGDYVRFAEAVGWHGTRVSDPEEIGPTLRKALDYGSPFLIELITASEDQVIPPVAPWQRWEASQAG